MVRLLASGLETSFTVSSYGAYWVTSSVSSWNVTIADTTSASGPIASAIAEPVS